MSNIRKRISSNSTSRSEKALFDTAVCLNDGWDIWMNPLLKFEVKQKGVSVDHEVDCILYHRDHGMLLIECKDGQISTEEAQGTENGFVWKQAGRIMDRSPIEQIKQSIHPLHDYFSEMFPKEGGKSYFKVRVQWAVCFADMENMGKIGGNAIQPKRIILKQDLKSYNTLERKIKKILETKEESHGGNPFPNNRLSDEDYNRLTSFLGCFDEPTWPELWEMESGARLQPTAFQEMLMESITRNPRMQIEGVAGSGKSLLVQWETSRLVAEGKRVVVLCYNDLLAEQMQNTFKKKGYDDSQVVAASFHKLACKYVRAAKVKGFARHEPEEGADMTEYYKAAAANLAPAIQELRKKKKQLFDALIIDKGQDFESGWIDATLQLLKDPEKGIVRFFYDRHQAIYKGRNFDANKTISAMPVMVLKRGYRSTKKILEWVYDNTNIRIPCYDETPTGRPVDVRTYTEPAEQEELLRKEIARLRKKGVGPEDILVVSLRSRRNSGLATLNDSDFQWSDINDSLNKFAINMVSAYRYKGLDKRVVILTDLELSPRGPGYIPEKANLIMVGATRAKEHLIVFRQRHKV